MSEQIQHKLYNYHAQPPNEAWEKIVSAMDTEANESLSEKLLNYQSAPPSNVWDNIAASLNETTTPVIPFWTRLSKPLKYVSAAASLLAIVMVLNLIFNKESVSNDSMALPGAKQNSLPLATPLVTEKLSSEISINKDRIEDRSPKSPVKNVRKTSQKMPLLTYTPVADADELSDRVVQHSYEIEEPEYLDRYMIFSKASGEAFRLSKKLFDLFACSDSDENCKRQIASMQEQMADPSIVAAGDFPAVLAVLQNMNNE